MRPSALVLFMVFGSSGGVSAQETEIAQLNARVRVLEERLAEVEAKLAAAAVRPQGARRGAKVFIGNYASGNSKENCVRAAVICRAYEGTTR